MPRSACQAWLGPMPARHYGSDYERTGDSIAIANYTGGTDEFDQAIASFAVSYAEQNDEDCAVFKKLLKSGDLPC